MRLHELNQSETCAHCLELLVTRKQSVMVQSDRQFIAALHDLSLV